jgi:microcystin-dependent protein
MPVHTHSMLARSANGTSASPAGMFPARDPAATPHYGSDADVTLAPNALTVAGGGQPHDNMPPHLTVTFLIALNGVFPSP